MKKVFFAALAMAAMVFCTSCNLIDLKEDGGSRIACTEVGTLNLEDDVQDSVRISFSTFPSTLADWVATHDAMNSAEGVVLMQLMAFELYHNNTSGGQRAVALNNTESAYTEVMMQLPQIFGKDNSKVPDTQYARPYIVWSYLEGATPDNGYTPTSPYTVLIRERLNSKQWSEMAGGYVYTLEVYSNGYDTPWRAVQVIRIGGNWKVFSSPALYTQCKKSRA